MAKKILIVEDDEKNRKLIKGVLSYHGYEIIEAADGGEGVALVRAHKPDLVLLDMQLPTLDGFAVAQILRSDPRTRAVRIIAVTALAMKDDRERILELGIDDYMAKPIDTRYLPELVKKYIGPAGAA